MSGHVGGVDEEVIHVDDKPSFCNHIAKRVVHKTLEGGGGIGKAEDITMGSKSPLWVTKAAFH